MTREEALKSVARAFLQAAYPDLTVEELEQKQCAFVDKALDPQRIYKYDPVELD